MCYAPARSLPLLVEVMPGQHCTHSVGRQAGRGMTDGALTGPVIPPVQPVASVPEQTKPSPSPRFPKGNLYLHPRGTGRLLYRRSSSPSLLPLQERVPRRGVVIGVLSGAKDSPIAKGADANAQPVTGNTPWIAGTQRCSTASVSSPGKGTDTMLSVFKGAWARRQSRRTATPTAPTCPGAVHHLNP